MPFWTVCKLKSGSRSGDAGLAEDAPAENLEAAAEEAPSAEGDDAAATA